MIKPSLLALVCCCGTALAAEHPELPATPQVARALLASPMVKIGDALLKAEQANSRRLAAGSGEWTVRITRQQREVKPADASQRYAEWDAAVERPLRLPGKAGLDEALGQAGISAGQWARGDALHEASRSLLAAWFEWLRQEAAAEAWKDQVEVLRRLAQSVKRRQTLGDASRLEAVQAEAALTQADAQWQQAKGKRAAAQAELAQRYPSLPLTLPTRLPEPEALDGEEAAWLESVLAHDHEVGLARAESRRSQLHAQRVDSERLPDPTLGLRLASERGGEEKLTGLVLSFTLPGSGRSAAAEAELARAEAAAQRESAALLKIKSEITALLQHAKSSRATWAAQREASLQLTQAADMAARAYALGEGSLSETLNARRQANETLLAARLAHLDALEKRDRLLLDAHQLWDLDGE